MKAKEIKDLISFISESGLNEVQLETEEIKLHIKKTPDGVAVPVTAIPSPQPVATAPTIVSTQTAAPETSGHSAEAVGNYVEIKSPMIGTFYRAASPEADPFVQVGDTVQQGSIVCIIEAMKLFNEIESEVSGKIVKVLVDNATPVEYDQPLFLVDPS